MKIDILGTESLGVRGLSCCVTLRDRKILIDPGIALGWHRHGFFPHPFQIAIGAQIREKIIEELKDSTDVVFSHFDGDHVPLAEPNPYQIGLATIQSELSRKKIWAKGAAVSSRLENKRRGEITACLGALPPAEGQIDGALQFSMPIPHGQRPEGAVSVMMTRIEQDGLVFVHASDHQFHHESSIEHILALKPDIVLTSGPALYLGNLSKVQLQNPKRNAIRLSKNVGTLIIDHHVLRSENGLDWIDDIASETGNRVVCAAEFMGRRPLLLEAWRERLYESMPVPEGWHEAYAAGEVDTGEYLERGMKSIKC